MNRRVAVVTGANRGIGFAIVKALCQQFEGDVYLTARNVNRGMNAVLELQRQGFQPKFHQLNITSEDSIIQFRDHLMNMYGGFDVLINNAGTSLEDEIDVQSFMLYAENTVQVNYFSLRKLCTILYPLLRLHARVVHISSSCGRLYNLTESTLISKLSNPDLTEDELDDIMTDFINAAIADRHTRVGWTNSAFATSKVGVTVLASIHQAMFDENSREDIAVNAVHPGYKNPHIEDDYSTNLSPEERAKAPVYCALLPENTQIKGKFIWHDSTVTDWK